MKTNKLIILALLVLICLQAAFSQAQSLKMIDPKIGYPQILDKNKLMKERQKIEKANDDNKPLTDYQQWLVEMGYTDGERDILDNSEWGDSWTNNCAMIKSISASSTLKPIGNLNYKAQNAQDDDLGTAWIEGAEGYGIGESITFCFPYRKKYDKNGNPIESGNNDAYAMNYSTQPVTTVCIYNGYMKSEKAWRDNSRVKQLKLYINGKPYALLNLKDTTAIQIFSIGRQAAVPELCLKFEITDVYKGDKYEDTAISEIDFDGEGCLCFAKGTMIAIPFGEKAIENLAVGDKVLTLNAKTNKVEEAMVLELANRKHHNLYELDFENVKITVTDDHPFYFDGKYYSVIENNTYGVITETLIEGQKINCISNGKIQTIELKSIKKLDTCEETYTITKLDRNRLFFANGICVSIE